MAEAVVLAVLLAALVVAALETGYRYGVKETESRWNEAVTRKEAHDKQERESR